MTQAWTRSTRRLAEPGDARRAGPPAERAPEKVLRDVEQGLVSLRRAQEEYGVVILEHPLRIDEEETERLREE